MPRNYVRRPGSRKYRDYDEDTLEKALEKYCNGKGTLLGVSQEYNVPYVTLYRKYKGLHMKSPGGPTILNRQEETAIVQGISIAAEWGFPFQADDIRELVKEYLNRRGMTVPKFKGNKPGEGWFAGFMKRHEAELSQRLSQAIKESRAKVNRQSINNYFDHLTISLQNVPPEAIVNYDETNFTDDPGRVKVVVRRTCKRAEKMLDTSKCATSVMFSCSASGVMLPVYVVYKAENLWSTWTEAGPAKARYNRSASGWFDASLFEDWFLTVALAYFKKLPPGPKVLVGDNLASHISLNVINDCENNNIRFVLLPASSTHLTQPLDVSCFRPIKNARRKVLRTWKKSHKGVIRKEVFPRLLKQALESINTSSTNNIISGFSATGLVPLNRKTILDKLAPEQTENAEAEHAIVASITELFKATRYGEAQEPSRKKKKIQVDAGKSITADDFHHTDEPPTQTSKSNKKRKNLCDDNRVDQVLEEQVDEDDHAEGQVLGERIHTVENNRFSLDENNLTDSSGDPVENDFIAVELKTTRGSTKQFVAKILTISAEGSFFCSFLRPSSKVTNAFVFPPAEDTGVVKKKEILKVLKNVEVLRRGGIRVNNFQL